MPCLLYPWGKRPQYPLDRRLGGPQRQCGQCRKGKVLDTTETRTLTRRPAHSQSLYQLHFANDLLEVPKAHLILDWMHSWTGSNLPCSLRICTSRFGCPLPSSESSDNLESREFTLNTSFSVSLQPEYIGGLTLLTLLVVWHSWVYDYLVHRWSLGSTSSMTTFWLFPFHCYNRWGPSCMYPSLLSS
jgi:hypothetical protein